MKIRKATLMEINDYIQLREDSLKEYSKIIGEDIMLSKNKIKKEFRGFVKSKKHIFFIVKEKKDVSIGFILATLLKNIWSKSLYIDDVFIDKKYRKKGVGTFLFKKLFSIMKRKNIKNCRLGVNPKNKRAMSLYKKLGFKITHY